MKYLKTYNESIRDKMKPKSDEEIWDHLKNLSPKEILIKSIEYNYIKGVKYVVENNLDDNIKKYIIKNINSIKSDEIISYLLNINEIKDGLDADSIYILEKYRFGLHQNEERFFETFFKNLLKSLTKTQSDYNSNMSIYMINDKIFANYFKNRNAFIINEKFLYDSQIVKKYNFNLTQYRLFLKPLISKHLDIKDNFIITFVDSEVALYNW